MKNINILLIFSILSIHLFAQNNQVDSLEQQNNRFPIKSFIIPTVFIGYGFIGINNDFLKEINIDIKEEVEQNVNKPFHIDDITVLSPTLLAYGLEVIGVEGKYNFNDKIVITSLALGIAGANVYGLKKTTLINRPDHSNHHSFPSGHTTFAFMGAEFLHQTYKDESILYSISGYLLATTTGLFRIYNNKHWLNDVIAGAGIGILSTKLAFLLHSSIKEKIRTRNNRISGTILPFYQKNEYGLTILFSF